MRSRPDRDPAAMRVSRARTARRASFEPLEPRCLLSADSNVLNAPPISLPPTEVTSLSAPSGSPSTSTAPGTVYYVADPAMSAAPVDPNGLWPTAAGNDANDGLTRTRPMASIAALLQEYNPGAGSVIRVGPGHFDLSSNLALTSANTGLTIVGYNEVSNPSGQAILDRANTAVGSNVIDLNGAKNVTLDHLELTGGHFGLYAVANAGSTGLILSNSSIDSNSAAGVDIEPLNDGPSFSYDTFHNDGTYGLWLNSVNDALVANSSADSDSTGFSVAGLRNLVKTSTASNDSLGFSLDGFAGAGPSDVSRITTSAARNNTSYGFDVQANSLVTGSAASGNDTGFLLSAAAVAQGDVAHNNADGFEVDSGSATSDRSYNNTTGFTVFDGSSVTGSTSYSNVNGIDAASSAATRAGFSGMVSNNLVYNNSGSGIAISEAVSGAAVVNNTVDQLAGDALMVQGGSSSLLVRNNILDAAAGADILVTADSQAGLNSDYNDFFHGPNTNAVVAYWPVSGTLTAEHELSDWQAASGLDTHSVYGDPLFVNPTGADGVLGYSTAGSGYDGGADDNFYLSAGSPAIDHGDAFLGTPTDITGAGRHDDPATPNLGSPDYRETVLPSSSFAATGTAQSWQGYNTSWNATLLFAFPFYGTSYSSVGVSSSGFLQFAGSDPIGDTANSTAKLLADARIAPLWANIRTDQPGDDIFIDSTVAGQVTFRWQASSALDGSPVNAAVTLFSDGGIRFDYGAGNANLSPTVGISRGDGNHFELSTYNGNSSLANVNSTQQALTPGLTYTDIGAYEFQGSSSDKTSATVTGISPAPIGTSTPPLLQVGSSLTVSFDKALNPIDANAADSYDLRSPGPDGRFGTTDDVVIPLTASYDRASQSVTLAIDAPGGTLSAGLYRLTVFGTIHNVSGNLLDGAGTGLAGSNHVFTFNAAAQLPAVVDNLDAGYTQTGTWTSADGYGGENNNYVYARGVTGVASATATWQTPGVIPGLYDVQVTWGAGSNRATNAPYQIYDGTTLLATVIVNQRLAPVGTLAGGVSFQSLGVFNVTSGTVRVVLGNNANGYVIADAVRIARPVALPVITDNGTAGYAQTGSWTSASGYGGENNNYLYAPGVTGNATATASWQTSGLVPGDYDVQVTWGSGSNRATNAPYQIYDGNTLLATVKVNQRLRPVGTLADGVAFQSLGVYHVASGTVRVVLGNNANGYVIADAVRIAPSTAVPVVADNGGGDFAQTGAWTTASGSGGYNNSYLYAPGAAGTGTATATWQVSGLIPGSYDVQVTWGAGSDSAATDAPYQIYDGGILLATVLVSQQLAPSGANSGGVAFQSLGLYNVTSGTLRVVLSNNANGYVVADAVRVAAPPAPVVADNQGPGYSQTGTWKNTTSISGYVGGYAGNYDFAAPSGSPSSTASAAWQITGVTAGAVDVQTTWIAGSNRATNAPYQIYDGTTLLATVIVNQRLAPVGTLAGGVTFQSLGVFNITSGTVRVVLGNNADGYVIADAVRVAPPAAVPALTDNGGAGYAQTGAWTTATGFGGENNNYLYAAGVTGTPTATATWQTSGLLPGSYDVQVTWGAGSNRATNASYQIYDGNTLLATVTVNQRLAPVGLSVGDVTYQSLGAYAVTSGTLRVVLTNQANGYVVADAVRVASGNVG